MEKKVHLEKVTWDNYAQICRLKVTKEQENYVASNKVSLIHAFVNLSNGIPVYAFGIYYGRKLVGFIQMMYDTDWTGDEHEKWLKSDEYKHWEGKPYYYIWRFMIDKRYQRNGYGREALKQAIEFVKNEHPAGKADYLLLSYEQNNEVGRKLYGSLGFHEVFNEYLEGDDEVTAMLEL